MVPFVLDCRDAAARSAACWARRELVFGSWRDDVRGGTAVGILFRLLSEDDGGWSEAMEVTGAGMDWAKAVRALM